MNQTTIDSDSAASVAIAPTLKAISDSACCVSLIHGKNLNSKQAAFEISLLSLNLQSAATPTLALSTPTARFSLAIQTSNTDNKAALPRSLTLSAGLIAHGYVPDGWLCGLLIPGEKDAACNYLTLFDSLGIYGRSTIDIDLLNADTSADSAQSSLFSKKLKAAIPSSVAPERIIEALYIDHEPLNLDESSRNRKFEELSDSLEIMVETLPSSGSDLSAAGLRYLAAEVK